MTKGLCVCDEVPGMWLPQSVVGIRLVHLNCECEREVRVECITSSSCFPMRWTLSKLHGK
jgi:hypothetical protein